MWSFKSFPELKDSSLQTDVFFGESESTDNVYNFLKFKPDVIEWCSCPDNSLRGGQMRWKHLHAIEFVIRLGTLGDIVKLPTEAKVKKAVITKATAIVVPTANSSISYKDDDYSLWFFAKVIANLMIVSTTNLDDNNGGNKNKNYLQFNIPRKN